MTRLRPANYMPELYRFLEELGTNNNRDWFKANKPRYEELRELWLADVDRMIAAMAEWWPQLRGVTARQCAYRIYRDTRFSLDKTPLKTYFSAGISPAGRATHSAGFYLHCGPEAFDANIDSGLYGGIWCPASPELKKLRKAIVDNIEEFEEILAEPNLQKYFPQWCGETLKTVPKGYDRNHPQAALLRRKDYGRFRHEPLSFFADPSWPEKSAELFSYLFPLLRFLDYSLKEEV